MCFGGRVLAVLLLLLAVTSQNPARGQQLEAPTVVPAIDGILKAFQNHALVAIGDDHNSAQEEDFYAALVRDPRFSTKSEISLSNLGAPHNRILLTVT
jgi:hypothetical protein